MRPENSLSLSLSPKYEATVRKGLSTNQEEVKDSIENIVSNIGTTAYDARWVAD